jgi:hypothetical protein
LLRAPRQQLCCRGKGRMLKTHDEYNPSLNGKTMAFVPTSGGFEGSCCDELFLLSRPVQSTHLRSCNTVGQIIAATQIADASRNLSASRQMSLTPTIPIRCVRHKLRVSSPKSSSVGRARCCTHGERRLGEIIRINTVAANARRRDSHVVHCGHQSPIEWRSSGPAQR